MLWSMIFKISFNNSHLNLIWIRIYISTTADFYFSLEVVSNTQSGLSYISQGYKVLVQTTPFRIDFVTGSEPLVSFNAQGLLKFEHYRQKSGFVMIYYDTMLHIIKLLQTSFFQNFFNIYTSSLLKWGWLVLFPLSILLYAHERIHFTQKQTG